MIVTTLAGILFSFRIFSKWDIMPALSSSCIILTNTRNLNFFHSEVIVRMVLSCMANELLGSDTIGKWEKKINRRGFWYWQVLYYLDIMKMFYYKLILCLLKVLFYLFHLASQKNELAKHQHIVCFLWLWDESSW